MSTKQVFKIAVMGAGLIGRRHVEQVLAETRTSLAAIIDPSPSGRAFAEEIGAAWHADFASALSAGRPDGVIIATPNDLHVENGLEAIAAGIPALVEKPVADNVIDAETLVATAERAGIPLLVGHHRRHSPLVVAAKEILESGELGTVLIAHGYFWTMKPDEYFDMAWRTKAGAGPVFRNLIHDVDLFRHFFGEVETVHAIESNAVRGHGVEETAVVLLRFRSGVLATVNVSDAVVAPWSWELTANENPAYPHQTEGCYRIGGTHGSLDLPALDLWSNVGKRDWLSPLQHRRVPYVPADPLVLQLQHFCEVIEGTAQPRVSGRDGLETLRVIEAVKASAKTGRAVEIRPQQQGLSMTEGIIA